MRDAIVISPHWDWDALNIPERNAMALASLGSRVLYCAPLRSFLRPSRAISVDPPEGIIRFVPRFLSDRANSVPGMRAVQLKWIARQILDRATELKLRDPIFMFNHLGPAFPLAMEMKRRGLYLVHVCQDYPEPLLHEHAEISDKTLVIQQSVYDLLHGKLGANLSLIDDAIPCWGPTGNGRQNPIAQIEGIPRPRLGYLGAPQKRLNRDLLVRILQAHPEWHFVAFGAERVFDLPNAHMIPWLPPDQLRKCVEALDVGFMPYDCSVPLSLHCLPLKRLDYFAAGIPVVATPILTLRNQTDLVYLGGTFEELESAISLALAEPRNDPRREARKRYARDHSIENLARRLAEELPLS